MWNKITHILNRTWVKYDTFERIYIYTLFNMDHPVEFARQVGRFVSSCRCIVWATKYSWNTSIRAEIPTSWSRVESHRIINSSVLQPISIPRVSWFILSSTNAHHLPRWDLRKFWHILCRMTKNFVSRFTSINYNTAMHLLSMKSYQDIVKITIVTKYFY